ncbi:MAG: hypothetical protein GY749_32210 [Desulfobacteraceae bacterium]|nr:hypothetical protein [Desulfobacteraceae bacterium]
MPWKIIKRRIGNAGSFRQRSDRQRGWDRKYGEGNWAIGYVIDKEFVLQEKAMETIYYQSYEEHFKNHPDDLTELIHLAKKLRNPHAEATTGVDLQVPAVMKYLERNNLQLRGKDVVDIGSWQGRSSHPICIRLSPLHIKLIGNPKMTLEKFWQNKKCLAIWEEEIRDKLSD